MQGVCVLLSHHGVTVPSSYLTSQVIHLIFGRFYHFILHMREKAGPAASLCMPGGHSPTDTPQAIIYRIHQHARLLENEICWIFIGIASNIEISFWNANVLHQFLPIYFISKLCISSMLYYTCFRFYSWLFYFIGAVVNDADFKYNSTCVLST